ncbi:MAG: MlaD family protein [Myxococcota bacterium]
MQYEVPVGGLLVVAMAGVVAYELGMLDFSDPIDVAVPLEDASGIQVGARVTISGVSVGEVDDVYLAGAKAIVKLSLDREAELRRDVQAKIHVTPWSPSPTVELIPSGDDAVPLLQDGDVLTVQGQKGLHPEDLLLRLTQIVEKLDPDDLANLSRAIRELSADPEALRRIVTNLDTSLQQAAELGPSAERTLRRTQYTLSNVDDRASQLDEVLQKASEWLDRMPETSPPVATDWR